MIPILDNDQLEEIRHDWMHGNIDAVDIMRKHNISVAEYKKFVDCLLARTKTSYKQQKNQRESVPKLFDTAQLSLNPHARIGITISDLKLMNNPDQFLQDNYGK